MAEGSSEGARSRQEARLGLQPLTDYAGTPLTIGWPILRKNIVDDVCDDSQRPTVGNQ